MPYVTDQQVTALTEKANEVRRTIVDILEDAGSGHTAGPLGMADIVTALYFHVLKHDPKNQLWEERDRLVLSNGHIVPVRYAAMAHAGYFTLDEARTLRKFGSRLQGHPERTKMPAFETTAGPLGDGLGQAAGMAYALRMDGKRSRVFCLTSDAEQQCGVMWEAVMFAGKNRLSNLTAIMDRNNIQISGYTEDIMPIEPLREKYEAFNWHVLEIDGHNIEQFCDATEEARAVYEKPTMIIAHTIPGKGIEDMEFDYTWHGKPPNKDQEQEFLKELRTLGGRIESTDHS